MLTSVVLPGKSQDSADLSALKKALFYSKRPAWGFSGKKTPKEVI